MTEKQCRGPCGLVKPLDEFYKRPTGKDGHFNECKLCYSARNKANRLLPANKERERDRNAAWRAANPERWKVLRKRAYEKSLKNGTSTKSRVTRQARVKAANPTGHVVSLKGIVERDGMHCFICNKPIEDKLQLTYDHTIPLARGGAHSEDNLHPAHKSCNSWKCDRLPDELVGLVPPEPGQVTDEEVYHIKKVNEAKSASHKKRLAEMTVSQNLLKLRGEHWV